MSTSKTTRRNDSLGLDASLTQLMALSVTLLLAMYLDYDRAAYFTVSSALFGVVIVLSLRALPYQVVVGASVKKLFVQFIARPIGYVTKHGASYVLGLRRGTAGVLFLEKVAAFFIKLSRLRG